MKHERAPAFDADLARLSPSEFRAFREVVRRHFIPACERRLEDPAHPWPKRLRVRSVAGARGVLELTWSFAGPDGRATFEWRIVDGVPRIRWRRIGGHDIFREP